MAYEWGDFGIVAIAARLKVPAVCFKLYWWYCSTMRRESNVSTWSQKKSALALGVSRATVNRWDKALVKAGAIELVGGHRYSGVRVLKPGEETLKEAAADVAHMLLGVTDTDSADVLLGVTDVQPACSTSATPRVTDADTYQSSTKSIKPNKGRVRAARVNSSLPFRTGTLGLSGSCSKCGQWKAGLYPTDKGPRCGKHSMPVPTPEPQHTTPGEPAKQRRYNDGFSGDEPF